MKKLSKALITAGATLLPFAASAQVTIDTNIATTTGLGSADLKSTVINIVNYVLGLLGLIAVIMIIIGGFQWLTAAGNEERVEKAKKVISAAVVGLIVILLAWAIVIFVVGTTSNVTA